MCVCVCVKGWTGLYINTPYVTVYLVITLPKIPYMHHIIYIYIYRISYVHHICIPRKTHAAPDYTVHWGRGGNAQAMRLVRMVWLYLCKCGRMGMGGGGACVHVSV